MRKTLMSAAVAAVLLATGCSAQSSDDVSGIVHDKGVDRDCESLSMGLASFASGLPAGKGGGSKSSKSKGNGGKSKTRKPKSEKSKGGKSKGGKSKGGGKPSSCEIEWELFVRNGDGVHEVDVDQQDYESCSIDEKYPKCTR